MPSFVVSTNTEPEWQRAKKIVKKEYPEIKEGSPSFYKLTTTIYKSITQYKPKNESAENVLLAALRNDDAKELVGILKSKLSFSREEDKCRIYSKSIDGSRRLIFSGSDEEVKDFIRAAEIFAENLRSF